MHKAKQINHSFFVYLFDRTWDHLRKVAGSESSVFCFRCYEKEKALAEKADRDMNEAVFIFLAVNSSKGSLARRRCLASGSPTCPKQSRPPPKSARARLCHLTLSSPHALFQQVSSN